MASIESSTVSHVIPSTYFESGERYIDLNLSPVGENENDFFVNNEEYATDRILFDLNELPNIDEDLGDSSDNNLETGK